MNQIASVAPILRGTAGAGLTRVLVAQALAVQAETLSEDAKTLARQCILDYIACALPGAAEPLSAILLAELAEQGGAETATVIGHAGRLPALSAALINGAAAHALDFDDVNMAMPGHPSVAILPALLALAEEIGADGDAVLAAFVAGYELTCRIGLAVAPGHYDGLGFHATGTLGSFGAAMACAHLMRLDEATSCAALGIAGTQAAGLKSMFGTMCKPFHAGTAAYHGLLSARLARRGFTSRDDVVECDQGFAATHSPDFHPEKALATPPGGLHLRNNLFKYHAACYLTHSPIEAARKLRSAHDLTPERIDRIRLRVDAATSRVCNILAPRIGLEAKFSHRLTVAMALSGIDTGRLDAFSDANAADPALSRLRDRVEIDFQSGWSPTEAELDLHLTDGQTLTARHDAGIPAADIAEQGVRLEQKFIALAEPLLGSNRARSVLGAVAGLDRAADVRGLMRLCA